MTRATGHLAATRDRGLLYAVNAGGNTITVLSVAGDRLIRTRGSGVVPPGI